ncbi:hypothetical protein D0T87_15645 [Bacteroides sp. 51]|nr:hypothetical protein [Bacteroides sp. 51]
MDFILQKYLNLSMLYYSILICCLAIITVYIQQEYLIIPQLEDMNFVSLSFKTKIFDAFYQSRILSFIITPTIIFIRISLVASCFYIGGYIFDSFSKLKYKKCFNISLKADIALLASSIMTCALLLLFDKEAAIMFQKATSLLYFFDISTLEPWLISTIGIFNLFEAIYWFLITILLAYTAKKTFRDTFNFVICTYGVGLIFYILFMVFIFLFVSR